MRQVELTAPQGLVDIRTEHGIASIFRSGLLQKLRSQHQIFNLLGPAFDLIFVASQMDVLDQRSVSG